MRSSTMKLRAAQKLVCSFSLLAPFALSSLTQQPAAPVVRGVDLAVVPLRGADTVVFRRSVTKNGQDSASGTRTVIRREFTAPNGARLLEVEQRFPARGGEIVDTALADARTMRATAHRSHQPKRLMRFEFVGDSAEGTVTAIATTGDTTSRVDKVQQNVGGPIFDSNVLELVVAGLPLAPDYAVELPFFIYERGGRVAMPLKVAERARVTFPLLGEREAWVVTLGVPGAPATLWIDTATRSVLRVRFDIAASAMSFTDDRVTPLRS